MYSPNIGFDPKVIMLPKHLESFFPNSYLRIDKLGNMDWE